MQHPAHSSLHCSQYAWFFVHWRTSYRKLQWYISACLNQSLPKWVGQSDAGPVWIHLFRMFICHKPVCSEAIASECTEFTAVSGGNPPFLEECEVSGRGWGLIYIWPTHLPDNTRIKDITSNEVLLTSLATTVNIRGPRICFHLCSYPLLFSRVCPDSDPPVFWSNWA